MHDELEAEVNDPEGTKIVPVKDLTPDKAAK